jgi:hypothetical protein
MDQHLAPGSVEEALARLNLDGLQSTVPGSGKTAAWFVDERPELLGRVASVLVMTREAGRLMRPREPGEQEDWSLWLLRAEIVQGADSKLGLGELVIGPELEHERRAPGIYKLKAKTESTVTAGLLRFVSPEKILEEAVRQLRNQGLALKMARKTPGPKQAASLSRLEGAQTRTKVRPGEQEIVALAMRYLVLVSYGVRHPLPQLASEFGLERKQVRDRLHRATKLDYLAPSKSGKATPRVGPRLLELGWSATPESRKEGKNDG